MLFKDIIMMESIIIESLNLEEENIIKDIRNIFRLKKYKNTPEL